MKKLATFLLVSISLFTTAQINVPVSQQNIKFNRWYRNSVNFGSIASPDNKTGERGTYATFEILNPSDNTVPAFQFRDKNTAEVFYSTNEQLLSNFRINIQNKELQDIVLPSPSRAGSIFQIGGKKISGTDNKTTFRAIYPHDNNQQFINAIGKFPKGTKIYYLWVYGVAYKDSVILHVDPDPQHRQPNTNIKYFYNTITDNVIKSFNMPRELIVAIAGESNSSGEGAPSPGSTPWANSDCHRSLQSGMYLGVQSYVDAHPELSILYKDFFVGCSGATIPDLITSTNSAQFNLLSNAIASHGLTNPPDVLLLSIGGNDINFHDIVLWLFAPGPELNEGLIRNKLGLNPSDLFRKLSEKYQYLNFGINNLRAKKTFLLGYPDLTHSTSQNFCGLPNNIDGAEIMLQLAEEVVLDAADAVCPGDCFSTPVLDYFTNRAHCYGKSIWEFIAQLADALYNFDDSGDWEDVGGVLGDMIIELGSTTGEYAYCYNNLLLKLNTTIKENCLLYNWGYMPGAAELTKAHGICNCGDPYFNTVSKSFILQNDGNGTAHMNKKAHSLVNKVIVENTLTNYLTDSANRKETVTISVNPNTSRIFTPPNFSQKIQEFKTFNVDITNKISNAKAANRQMINARIKNLKPRLAKLKEYFHKKALAEKKSMGEKH